MRGMQSPLHARLDAMSTRSQLRGKAGFVPPPTAPLGGCPLCGLGHSHDNECSMEEETKEGEDASEAERASE